MKRLSHTISRVREHFGAWLRVTLILVVLAGLFFVAGGGVSHNDKWHIDHIDISGTDTNTMDTMRALVRQKLEGRYYFVYSHANSYIFPKSDIEKMLLDTFPRINEISASRIDDHTISVKATERERYALWCGNDADNRGIDAEGRGRNANIGLDSCWFIDGNGFVFDRSPTFSRGVYVETYGKLVEKNEGEPLRGALPYGRFMTANNFSKLLREKIGKPFQIELKPDSELEVRIQSSVEHPFLADVTIRFKDESNPETLVNNLLKALPVQFPEKVAPKKKLQYIDMRFGNKVIFGFE